MTPAGLGPAAPCSVLVVDPDPLVRRTVVAELEGAQGIDAITDVTPAFMGVAAVETDATVVVLEPHVDGRLLLDELRQLTELPAAPRVLVFSAAADVATQIDALAAGALGFLHKEEGVASLPGAILAVARGETAISRRLTLAIIERLRVAPLGNTGMRPVRSALTAREWEVLELLEAGLTTTEIAGRLVVSSDTVYSHVKNIMRKLGVHTRPEAVAAARATPGRPGAPAHRPGGRSPSQIPDLPRAGLAIRQDVAGAP